MKLCSTKQQLWDFLNIARKDGLSIGFVPTMGFLHKGHLSLMETGKRLCKRLVVSIFVNPSQFAPTEDFSQYPRDLKRDCKLLEDIETDVLFFPDSNDIYPDSYETYIELNKLPHHLCCISRPIFFRGVTTIVAKLFNIVKTIFLLL